MPPQLGMVGLVVADVAPLARVLPILHTADDPNAEI